MNRFVVRIRAEKCKGCELCISVCPKQVLAIGTEVNAKGYCSAEVAKQENCIGCQNCALMCPDGAIEIFRLEEGDQ